MFLSNAEVRPLSGTCQILTFDPSSRDQRLSYWTICDGTLPRAIWNEPFADQLADQV